jgi:hypothetical protein
MAAHSACQVSCGSASVLESPIATPMTPNRVKITPATSSRQPRVSHLVIMYGTTTAPRSSGNGMRHGGSPDIQAITDTPMTTLSTDTSPW